MTPGHDPVESLDEGTAAFAIDVLACPHCGGRLRLLATLHDPAIDVLACPHLGGRLRLSGTLCNPAVIRKLLAHLGMARSAPSPGPAPPELGAAAP